MIWVFATGAALIVASALLSRSATTCSWCGQPMRRRDVFDHYDRRHSVNSNRT